MTCKPEDLIAKADHLFTLQAPIRSMWQIVAENFYPMRADFDMVSQPGRQPADWLADSYPVLCHRDLSNSIDAMLRTDAWFQMTLGGGVNPDHDGKRWLEDKTRKMRAHMGARESGFSRAIKQGDMDYCAFGQTVIQVGMRQDLRGPLYQNWHLRDCAWFDNEEGNIHGLVRKWRPTREQLLGKFPKMRDDPQFMEALRRDPFEREELYHMELPSTLVPDSQYAERKPMVSFWFDRTRAKILEEIGTLEMTYVVPRFLTLAESPYAYSPATMAGLPDARTIQAMTFTLLEAAERFTNPPVVATQKAILGTIDLSPSGVTYVDDEYDERTGEALRPLISDKSGYPIGQHERSRIVETLTSAFFLDKIRIPQKEQEMTAYEVAEMMKEYRRQNLPLFAPIESEYNGQICERTFSVLMRSGHFGPMSEIPDSLLGQEIQFKYKSPLSSAEEGTRAAKFSQIQQQLSQSIELDKRLAVVVDLPTAFRSAVEGMDVPPEWIASEKDYQAGVEQQRLQEQAAAMAQAAQVAADMGVAA